MPKRITLDDLALMVKVGFDDVAERFDKVEGRLDKIEDTMATKEDLEKVRNQMATKEYVNERIGELEEKLFQEYGSQLERQRDDIRLIKTRLKLS